RIARRLPAGAGAEGIAADARLALVAGTHVEHLLVVEQVVHRQAGLEIDVIHGQGPHQAGTDVVGPRHAAEGAALAALVDAVLPCARAIGHAQPAGTAAAAFTG